MLQTVESDLRVSLPLQHQPVTAWRRALGWCSSNCLQALHICEWIGKWRFDQTAMDPYVTPAKGAKGRPIVIATAT